MPGRHLLALVDSASATLLFLLAARMTGSWKWAMIAPLLFLGAVPVHPGDFASFNIPYPTWYNLFFFALSATMLPGLAARPTPLRLLACGLLAGIGFTFKPNVGLFQLAASALVCLQGFGRPRNALERGLWWTWWAAILAGLLVVFSSVQSLGELAGFLAPAMIAAVAVARDAHRSPPRPHEVSLLACGIAMAAGFLAACVPWLAWSWSILGPDWFARRALFLGAGFESVYYLTAPPLEWSLAVLAGGVLAWRLPAWIERRGWPAWPLPPAGALLAVLLFVHLLRTRPMPDGAYAAVMKVAEPNFFAAATFVQLAMLLLWLLRPVAADDERARLVSSTLVCGVMLYLQIFPRTDVMHWVSAAPLLFPAAAWLMQSLALRWSAHRGALVRRIVGFAVALPVVAIALLRLGHFFDARWDLIDGRLERSPETVLRIPHAPLAIDAGRADTFRDLEAAVGFVTGHSAPDEPVFTFPALDYLSYFSLRKPGNRHGYYFPGWPGHDTEAEVLASLERRPPRLAVTLYEPQLYFSNAAAYYFLLADFFEPRYERVARRGPYAILARSAAIDAIPPEASAGPGRVHPSQPSAIADAVGPDRVRDLSTDLRSGDVRVRLTAVQRMAEWHILGDFAPLLEALADPAPEVRSSAAKAVTYTRSAAMRDALLGGVAGRRFDTTASVRAIRALRGSCDASCVPLLLPLTEGYDLDTEMAARSALSDLPISRWQSDFWWKWEGEGSSVFPEPARSRLRAALEDPSTDPELRKLAFVYADHLGLGPCPEALRQWGSMRMEQAGFDPNVSLSLHHLSRAGCEGPWLESALHWLRLEPTLSPRTVLREEGRNPGHADAALAVYADARFGSASALAHWMCGMVGDGKCLAAARSTLEHSPSEEERVAAAWAWSQLASDDAGIAELLEQVAGDASPQVRETAGYGIERRRLREAAARPPS